MKNQMKNRMKLGDVNASPSLYMVFGPKVAVSPCGCALALLCPVVVFALFALFLRRFLKIKKSHTYMLPPLLHAES